MSKVKKADQLPRTPGLVHANGTAVYATAETNRNNSLPPGARGTVSPLFMVRDRPEWLANSAHLVACWNACDGFSDPAQMRAERDHLLKVAVSALLALESARPMVALLGAKMNGPAEVADCLRRIDETLAEATGPADRLLAEADLTESRQGA